MVCLGVLAYNSGDLGGAETWFERAARAGNTTGMDNLGALLKNRGDLDEAQAWYRRAAEAGSTIATEGLAELRRKIDYSDHKLDSIKFDTFGWEMVQNDDGLRVWRNNDASLGERFVDSPPEFDSWDAEEIRETLMEGFDLVVSPTFRLDDLPQDIREWLPAGLPEQVSLLEMELFEIGPAKCVLATTRPRVNDEVHYMGSLTILFAECFWSLTVDIEEDELLVGEREGAVVRSILEGSTTAESSADEFDPYDRRWDGLVPLEHDPLTRVRLLMGRLRDSIQLGEELLELEPFAATED
jgi:hypothetical protein